MTSPLYLAVTRAHEADWSAMPPKENDKLSAEQVGYINEWIVAGAPWPDAKRVVRSQGSRSLGRDRWGDGENQRRTDAGWTNRPIPNYGPISRYPNR